jgi:elongation factor G
MGVFVNSVPADKIRNVALVGHGGVGKTSLAEALLHRAGVTTRQGRVEDANTVCDYDATEHERGISLSLALAPLEWNGFKINLIDTPGYADFVGDVWAALQVADLAVFVVSAVEGVEVQHEVVWRRAAELKLPRLVFINKLDRERASFEATLDQLRDTFGAGIAPLELPIGEEASFRGIADLLTDTAWTYSGGKGAKGDIPDEMADLEHQVHDNLVEGIVVADDEQLERYLEGDIPSMEELEHTLAHGVASASVFPVVCGSATANIGVDRLADFIVEIGPAPGDRPPVEVEAAGEPFTVASDPAGEPLAVVFKTIADPYVGHVSLFKVLSGTIRPDDHLVNTRTGHDERLHNLSLLRGRETLPVTSLPAGDIGAAAKLADTRTGDTLAPKGKPVKVPALDRPRPVLSVAIAARNSSDEDKLATALHRLQEEDPAIQVHRDDQTHQTLLRGMGETHLSISLDKLARKYGVTVDTEDVKVRYLETITGDGDAEGRHKKQSGGRGQFGVASVRIEPLERGGGFVFESAVVGGAIPSKFIPSVEKGVAEAMQRGGMHGHPVVDVKATVYDGKFHNVDSDEMSFKTAGRLAFRAAMADAGPVILEPVSKLEVTVPIANQGDIMGDLNARRGRVQGTEMSGPNEQTITALVPTAEILRYAIDLRSMTGGRGRFTAEHDHYDPLPAHLVDQVSTGGHHEED